MFWFNLNKVQAQDRGAKPSAGQRIGAPIVDPVKYEWFNNADFRRAVSMAIDRDAMIKGVFYGYGEQNWSQTTSSNKEWHSADVVKHDYNPEAAKKLLAGIGFKDTNGDGFLEDASGNQVGFMLRTNSSNALRIAMANFIRDDLAKVGVKMSLTPVDFNTIVSNIHADFQYEAILLGFQSSVPPTPFGGQNVWRSSGESHQWFVRQHKPATPQEARIDQLLDVMLTTQDTQAAEVVLGRDSEHPQRSELVHLAADPAHQGAGERPVRQRAAQRDGPPHRLEHRTRVRQIAPELT